MGLDGLGFSPKEQMKSLQKIFYNSDFTYEASHKKINDKLWEVKSAA